MRRRVVVTGLGFVIPHGADREDVWQQILGGQSGIRKVRSFEPVDLDTQIAGELDAVVEVPERVGPYPVDDATLRYVVSAGRDALAHAALPPGGNPRRRGVVLASGIGPDSMANFGELAAHYFGPDDDVAKVPLAPFYGQQQRHPAAAGLDAFFLDRAAPILGSMLGGGRVYNTASACASGSQTVADGGALIRRGELDVALVGGVCTAVNRAMVPGFAKIGALSTRNHDPAGASRPFDADRDGFVLSDGVSLLVLEELGHALERGAPILAELLGWGYSADAYRLTDPHPEGRGMALAMSRALSDAGLGPEAVDYINAHGTSTPYNDALETLAIKMAFGEEQAYRIPVSSTKSMTGHLVQGAGAIEASFCVLALRDQVVPPTINYTTPDPKCDLDYVPNVKRELDLGVVQSNSFGFGGQNASVILGAWRGE